jgi:hypothetical protein
MVFLLLLMGCMIAADARPKARSAWRACQSAQRFHRNFVGARKPAGLSTQQNFEETNFAQARRTR